MSESWIDVELSLQIQSEFVDAGDQRFVAIRMRTVIDGQPSGDEEVVIAPVD
jgi:hypothetical protein